jgi:hypothetical protein
MKKKKTLSFFDTNPFVLFCVIFSVAMVVNGLIFHGLVLGIIFGEPFYFTIGHLIDTATLSAVPVVTIVLFGKVPLLKYFNDDNCSPWISVPVHYVISSALLLLFTFVIAHFEPAPAGVYISAILPYTQGYIVVVILAIVIEVRKISNVNRNLKKIQDSLIKNKMSKGDTQ